jgi:hypothetical protein
VADARVCIVFAREAFAGPLRDLLQGTQVRVNSRAELTEALARHAPVAVFVDCGLLPQLDGLALDLPVIGIADDHTLAAMVATLAANPGLAHLVTANLLASPLAASHFTKLLGRFGDRRDSRTPAATATGRAALLSSSSRREARLDRMREFFASQQVPDRTIEAIVDTAEELVTNALFDAPSEAGYFKQPVSRTEEVELPPEHACEISYGVEDGSVFVRMRDPFGALTRARLLGVLQRCSASGVALDESRGGAGLGLWRVFSAASTIEISVIPSRVTEIVVRLDTRKAKKSRGKDARAVHLYFPTEHTADGAQGRFAADHDHDLLDDSFTALYPSGS